MDKQELVTITHPKSPIAEAYRTLRTNIQFSSFDKSVKTVTVTSSGPGEGKSTVASNLAVVTAQSGKKTLLIDCDQRRSRLHKVFGLSNMVGLSNMLAGEVAFPDVVQQTEIDNLYILTAGTRPPNPSELLASEKMKSFIHTMREEFDYVIMDTPPVLIVTDAQLLADYTDGYLLVVSSGAVDRNAAAKSKELLENVNAKLLGVVLNNLEISEKGYYGYYYHYYYGTDGQKVKARKRK